MKLWHGLFLSVVISTTSLAAEGDITFEELQASHQAWQANVEFYSTYTYQEGSAPNHDAVFTKPNAVNMTALATGVFHKMGSTYRQSRFFKGGPAVVRNEKKGETQLIFVRHSPQDEVYDERLSLRYNPKWKNFNDTATYARRADIPVEPGRKPCFSSEDSLTPLNPVPGCFADFPGAMHGIRAAKKYEIQVRNDKSLLLTGKAPEPNGGTNRIEIEWTILGEKPVITRVYRTCLDEKGKTLVRAESRLSDFQKCPGGHVAKLVTVAITADKGPTAVRIWQSNDLGQKRPQPKDFEIAIPASTNVIGLNNPPPTGKPRRLSLFGNVGNEVIQGPKVIKK